MTRGPDDLYGQQPPGPLFARGWESVPFADSPFPPTKTEALLAGLIWRHRGRENPISIARLRELTKLGEREIKSVVERLVVAHRIRIGARRGDPVGYFIIETAEDQEIAAKPYRNQVLAMLRRLRVLESPERMRELLGQIRLEVNP